MPPLSPDQWRILSPYLDQALEIEPDARADWFASIALQDPSLAADLQSILAAQDVVQESHFLEQPVLDPHEALEQSLVGQVVGSYRLVSFIGQGGTGSVWLAERCDGRFQGRAAVKLLNLSLIGRAGEERFRREGTFLARLRHPRIAHLIDAGISPAGQPYLVLEHVNGQSIDRYCNEHGLGIDARIGLFLEVLDAVAQAHTSLIVHRDIKPANVLVSVDGEVKLLDFGIAKLLEPTEWGTTAVEDSGVLLRGASGLTPEYAAPEQLVGGAVTTATDVYALGVLLYVLLSGQHPAGDAVQSPDTLVRAIVGEEPQRVSQAVVCQREPMEVLADHAKQCGTTPRRLRRMLRGDLDAIVAKALKKDASERYASVAALADDLRRYLRHEPISARPDTVQYRTARFVRRHVGGVATSAAVLALVSGLTVVHTTRLATERDRAQREAERAAKVSEALTRLLETADPIVTRATRDRLTVRGMLDAGAEQLQLELTGQPEAQAEIFTVMGRIYRRHGVFLKAQQFLEQALASGRKVFGAEHVRVAQTLNDLGVLQTETGDYGAAERNLAEALEMRRRLLGPEHADVAITLVELGRVYQDLGFNQRAEPLLQESLAIRRKVLGDGHRETAVSLNAVASVLRLNGDLEGAESLQQQSLELNRETRGENHPNTGTSLHDLGLIAVAKGHYATAEWFFRQGLDRLRRSLGDKHPSVAIALNGLSRALVAQGRYDEAASSLQEALEIARSALASNHQLVAIYAINLASIQLARKEPAAAEALLREGLRIRVLSPGLVPSRRRTFPEEDWSVGATKSLLGASLVALGRYAEAEKVLLDARRDLEASPAPRDLEMKATITRLVELYSAWGKHDRATEFRALLGS
jgi:serine/threonine protein kinase/tetratricopeptide (TPR) repeat protein